MTLLTFSFWAYFLYFLVAVGIAFFIPGDLLLSSQKLSKSQRIILGTVVGMVMWAWQGFIFGFLDVRWLSYIYILILVIYWLKKNRFLQIINSLHYLKFKIPWLSLFLIGFGTLLQLANIFLIGVMYKEGMYFCCGDPDSLYHIALTNQLTKGVPPIEPGMVGTVVHNYHYLSNLIAADLIRVFRLPLIATVSQYFVFLISLLIGLSAFTCGKILKMKTSYINWLIFFLYFSGDLVFLFIFFIKGNWNFGSPFLENAAGLWYSPPRVYALVILLGVITVLQLWLKKKDVLTSLLLVLMTSSLIGVKVYFGIFALAGLSVLTFLKLLKKDFSLLGPYICTILFALLLYLPVNQSSGGLFFVGTWRFENFIVQPEFGLDRMELARTIYVAHSNYLRVIGYEVLYIFLYIVVAFGTITLGLVQSKKSLSLLPKEINIFLLSGIGISTVLGSFFWQRIGGANSIQFLITIDIIGSVYAALACFYWLEKKNKVIKILCISIILILTVPRTFYQSYTEFKQRFIDRKGLTIHKEELQALTYLREETPLNALVLVDNNEHQSDHIYLRYNKKDVRHWKGPTSYYISILADRQIFLDGNKGIVQDHGIDIKEKLDVTKIIFNDKNRKKVNETLTKNKIDYVYLTTRTKLPSEGSTSILKEVLRNREVRILKVFNKN